MSDTMRRMWNKKEIEEIVKELLEIDEYYLYCKKRYTEAGKSHLFEAAWNDMLEVDIDEIERDGSYDNYYGKLQYPNADINGVIIPLGTTKIGDYAFYELVNNDQLLIIPNSVVSVGDYAFYEWQSNNQPLVIPDSVTSIGNNAFRHWINNNKQVIISEGVTSIGDSAFNYWSSNNQPLVIPNSVTSIGNLAFLYWEEVPYIIIKATTPPTLSNKNSFSNQDDAPIYVPDESVDNYKNDANWSDLANRIFSIEELEE